MIILGGRNNNAPFPAVAGSFNDTDNYIVQGDITGLFSKTSEWTALIWVKTSTLTIQTIFAYRKIGGNFLISLFSSNTPGTTGYIRVNAAGNLVNSTENIADGSWHFICVQNVSDGGGGYDVDLYVDNVLVGSGEWGAITEADPSLYVGYFGDGGTLYFSGSIVGPFYYSRKLTATELSEIYTYGAMKLPATGMEIGFPLCEQTGSVAYDVSGNGNDGTWNGTTPYYATQEAFLYPRQKGYSKYTKSGASDLYVPYGIDGNALSITPPAGYTKAFDAPA
jgi:hypothetical protein